MYYLTFFVDLSIMKAVMLSLERLTDQRQYLLSGQKVRAESLKIRNLQGDDRTCHDWIRNIQEHSDRSYPQFHNDCWIIDDVSPIFEQWIHLSISIGNLRSKNIKWIFKCFIQKRWCIVIQSNLRRFPRHEGWPNVGHTHWHPFDEVGQIDIHMDLE
jgi:hypothetical protein